MLPLAVFADTYGKKFLGRIGIIVQVLGMGCLVAAANMTGLEIWILLSPERKALASSFFIGLSQLGISCSGIFAALVIKRDWGFVQELAGVSNIYSIILLCSIIPLPFVTYLMTKGLIQEKS